MGNHPREKDLPSWELIEEMRSRIESSLKDLPDEISLSKKQLLAASMRVELARWKRSGSAKHQSTKAPAELSPTLVAKALWRHPTKDQQGSVIHQLQRFDENAGSILKVR